MSKRADLIPPLGFPGGPHHLIDRIEQEVRNPRLKEHLKDKVECGEDLTNQEASWIYHSMESEKGPGRIIKKIRMTAHDQYRLDLRGITIPEIRLALRSWEKHVEKLRSTKDPMFHFVQNELRTGSKIEWTDSKLRLFVVFASSGPGQVDIITSYWLGQRKPRPSTRCKRKVAQGYRPEDNLPGYQTFVKHPQDGDTGDAERYRQVGLPRPNDRRWETQQPRWEMNTPGGSGSHPDGSLHKDRVRTKGTPGQKHPEPEPTDSKITPKRRPLAGSLEESIHAANEAIEAAMKGPPYPTSKTRQREQRGEAKRETAKNYRKNKTQKKLKTKRWLNRNKNKGLFKRDQKRREERPERFERRPGGGVSDRAEYQKEYREKNKEEIAKKEKERREKSAYTPPSSVKRRPSRRQRRQRGRDRWKARQRYKKNRNRNRQRARQRYKRLRHNPTFKKQQKVRRKHPQRFKRRLGEVLTAPEIAFVIGKDLDLGYVRSLSGMTSLVTFYVRNEDDNKDTQRSLPLSDFMASAVFLSEADADAMFELVDQEVGPEAYDLVMTETNLRDSAAVFGIDCDSEDFKSQCEDLVGRRDLNELDPEDLARIDAELVSGMVYSPTEDRQEAAPRPHEDKVLDPQDDDYIFGVVNLDEDAARAVADRWLQRRATFTYEKHPPDLHLDNRKDRAEPLGDGGGKPWPDPDKDEVPGGESPVQTGPGPGSRVLPHTHNQGPTKTRRYAYKIGDIFNLTSPELRAKAKGVKWSVFRNDPKNAVVLFDAQGSDGKKYRVRMKALRRGNVRDLQKLDILVSCTCPAWRWQGPEHWAKKNNYLYGRPKGTASKPVVRDPNMEKGACKHVLAVLDKAVKYNWKVRPAPKGKTAGIRYLSDTGTPVEVWAVHPVPNKGK